MTLSRTTIEHLPEEVRRLTLDGIRSPHVRRMAEEAIQGQEDGILAIFTYLKRWPYLPDPYGRELLIAPNRIAEDYFSTGRIYSGDCDDLAMLSAAVLGSIGYPVRVALASYRLDRELEHAYAEVHTAGTWIPFDLSSSFPLGWVHTPTREVIVELTA